MHHLLTNKITALFMGKMDLRTGKWFPFQKMTWEENRGTDYLNLSVTFIEGAKRFRTLYPKSKNVIEYGRVMKYRDINYCPWRDRMPLSRPLENKYRKLYGFDLKERVDPIEYAIISGGYSFRDRDGLFPELAPDEHGNYNFIFSGIDSWYMPSKNRPELELIPVGAKATLQSPEKLEIKRGEWEEKNPPPEAIRLKIFVEGELVGYAPPYIKDLHTKFGDQLQVEICQKNQGAYFDHQFLFKATINQAVGIPFSHAKYQIFRD